MLAANARGYGHGRFAGVFPVVKRQGKCGRKTRKVHVSQPVTIGVCYAVVVLSFNCLIFSRQMSFHPELQQFFRLFNQIFQPKSANAVVLPLFIC